MAGASRLYGDALDIAARTGREGPGRGDAPRPRLRVDTESAAAHLDEALALARETELPRVTLAGDRRARAPDVDAALAALAQHEERATHEERMNASASACGS